MIKNIKVNLEAIEVMNYFWHAAAEKEHIDESFFQNAGQIEAMKYIYDDEFNEESVRLVLSAIKNRELINGNKKEMKFWNYNMWVMEDFEYTQMMIDPCKKLNLDFILGEIEKSNDNKNYEEIEVVFSMMYDGVYEVRDNKLIVNFFRVKPDDLEEGKAYINNIDIKEFMKEKIIELLR